MKKPSTLLMLAMAILFSLKAFSLPKLNSLPGAQATIYLDFDGQAVYGTIFNNGDTINCAPAGMTDAQIIEIFNRVSEDYRPFNINITTHDSVFLAAPIAQRVRVIITPTNYWHPGSGGVSWIGAFTTGDDTPSFVFCNMLGPNNPRMVAECCSHESGHALGLTHQSKYSATNCDFFELEYHPGFGSGETGWAPIMGLSYYKNMTNWNNGPTPYGCTELQDNLATIVTQNGFTYRADDYGEAMDASTYTLPSTSYSVNGIITTNSDKDAFRIVLTMNSNFHLTAIPFNLGPNDLAADLDIKLELYNASGTLLRTYDPLATMSVTVDTILTTGTYFIKIDGTGNANIGEYGSLGSYTLSGTNGPLPIHDVNLTGIADKGKHNLNWKIVADEPIKTIAIESSDDGVNFKLLTTVPASSSAFSYSSYQAGNVFYRLKVTSVLDQTVYSNTIVIAGADAADQQFYVSTLVQNEITVNAPANYQYVLNDINGRAISKGTGVKGINRINISTLQDGMYIIQLFNTDKRQTQRIIKQ